MRIPVSSPSITDVEVNYVRDAVRSGWISGSKGEFISRFEKEFSNLCGTKYGVACSSGTAALQLATLTIRLKPGDQVIVPTFTNIATVLAVIYAGATPVLIDSDPQIWGMDANGLDQKITPKTKAIIPVHIYGHPVDMSKVMKTASEYGLTVIEDAAEAHGAEYKGQKIGGIGDMGCFSFYANKIVTTGEGGMIVTNNGKAAKKMRILANLAYSDAERYRHSQLGYNYRMSNILAALGCAQLMRIDRLVEFKRSLAFRYNSHLSRTPGVHTPVEMPWAKSVYWMYGIVLDESFGMLRDQLRQFLSARGIETRGFFYPMHRQPVFQRLGMFKGERYRIAERLSQWGLYLPSGFDMSRENVQYVSDCVKEAHEKAAKR